METAKATHWGAALIGGLCVILASAISAVVTYRIAERQHGEVQKERDEPAAALEEQARTRDLDNKLAAQNKVIANLLHEIEILKHPNPPPALPAGGAMSFQGSSDAGSGSRGAGSPGSELPVVTDFPFHFTLEKCFHIHGENRVDCHLLIANISDKTESLLFNAQYYMGGRVSFLADQAGNRYGARVENDAVSNAMNPAPEFLPHVPTAAVLHFDKVPDSLGQVTVVFQADQGQFGRKLTFSFPNVILE